MSENKKPIILIIDDDQDYLEILKLGLSNEFEIITVFELHRLEIETQGIRPSLILLDKHIGSAKPEEVIGTIQGLETLKDIPVLLMSGTDTGKKGPYAYMFEDFMVKPSNFQEVREKLRNTLDRYCQL